MMYMLTQCTICKKNIQMKPSHLKKVKSPTCSRFCFSKLPRTWIKQNGRDNPMWKGGFRKRNGYLQILNPGHPFADKKGYVMEHRLVMEKKIGRHLKSSEIVHHINGNLTDNRIKNLELLTQSSHFSRHKKEYWKRWRINHT